MTTPKLRYEPTITLGNLIVTLGFLLSLGGLAWKLSAMLTSYNARIERLESLAEEHLPKLHELVADKIARDAIDRAIRDPQTPRRPQPTPSYHKP